MLSRGSRPSSRAASFLLHISPHQTNEPRPNYCANTNTECYCGESLPASMVELSDTSCSMACAGDSEAFCGGRDAIMIYSLDGDGGATDGSTSTPPPTR